jgi:hypothetical protein
LNQEEYKLIYYDIINGYSFYSDSKISFYIKHFSLQDINLVNTRKLKIEAKARKLGLLDEKTQMDNLIAKDNWSKAREEEVLKLRDFIKNLKYTKTKLILSRDIEDINKQIKENEDNLNSISAEKQELLGTTLESYTNKKINEYYVYCSLYKDESLINRLFTEEQFDELDYNELFEFYAKYNIGLSKITEKNIKKISLSGFFLNSFYLCDDDPYVFFGKPIINLTFSQIELFACAKYYKNILTNSTTRPPDNVMEDPEALIDWYEGSKNTNELLGKSKNKKSEETLGTSLVGASAEDLKKVGMENKDGISLVKEAEKKGGSLSFHDLIKLHNA